jgi:GcrA cell cycle regulator
MSGFSPPKTEAFKARLRALWATGLSAAKIAEAMNVSKNSVFGLAHRMNLPTRPSPIKRSIDPQSGEVVKREKSDRLTLAPGKQTLPPLACVDTVVIPPPAPVIMPLRKSEPCCWPIGEPGKPSFHFCDAPSVPGKAYCEAHRAIGVAGTGSLQARTLNKLAAL